MFTILHISRQKDFCVKKGPFQQRKKDFCVKKGPKKDHFRSLVLKRTKSLIKDLYASTVQLNTLKEPHFLQKQLNLKDLVAPGDRSLCQCHYKKAREINADLNFNRSIPMCSPKRANPDGRYEGGGKLLGKPPVKEPFSLDSALNAISFPTHTFMEGGLGPDMSGI